MEKSEWREAFNRQPVHYIFFDFSVLIPINSINTICQVLQNIIALSSSLKGSSRFTMLGIYMLSERSKCVFPLQSIKYNYVKLQISLESMLASHVISINEETSDVQSLIEILQDAIKQYENYFQNAVLNAEEWPQIQLLFFTAQTSQNFLKMMQQALSSIHLAYINKVQAVILRCRGFSASSSLGSKSEAQAESSPVLFANDDTEEMISSLIHITEIETNKYQIENVFKYWLHDYSMDSDHLRLTLGSTTLRCDIRECALSAEALPVSSQFFLLPEGGGSHHQAVRPTSASNKPSPASKVPIYTMDAVAVVQKEGLCQSLLFGHSYTATPTECWKIEWDELDRNQQLFLAITRHLLEKDLVLLAKKKTAQIQSSEKVLPTGFFAFFPSNKNKLLVKSVMSSELVLPVEEIPDKEIPFEVVAEAKECLENLEFKATYNPLMMTSGLYAYLQSIQNKRMRPTTSFVTPIVTRDEDRVEGKRKKKGVPVPPMTEMMKNPDLKFKGDFMTASTMLKNKFPQDFD